MCTLGREDRLHLGASKTLLYLSPGGVRTRQSLLPPGPAHSGAKTTGVAQMGLLGVKQEGATERAAGSDTSPLTGLTPRTEELTIHRCLGCRPSQRHLPHPSHASPRRRRSHSSHHILPPSRLTLPSRPLSLLAHFLDLTRSLVVPSSLPSLIHSLPSAQET